MSVDMKATNEQVIALYETTGSCVGGKSGRGTEKKAEYVLSDAKTRAHGTAPGALIEVGAA